MTQKYAIITGASGFMGSNALEYFLAHTDWKFICPCSWKHHGAPERILELPHYDPARVEVITHDLTAPFSEYQINRWLKLGIDYIINIASESHVDRSIADPVTFVRNNVDLALTMLELARVLKPKKFIQFSTDEVYGDTPKGQSFKEWSPVVPSNPYSASKACQDDIAISYWRTYRIPLIMTNTMNIISFRQDKEKYLPKIISHIMHDKMLTIHGKNKQECGKRHYISANNVAAALLHIINKVEVDFETEKPKRFNIVSDTELNNYELAERVAEIMDKPLKYVFTCTSSIRPGYDKRYCLDGQKLLDTGFTYPESFDESLKKIVDWYMNHPDWVL